MAFFDFLKRKKETEKINSEELKDWIKDKMPCIKTKEKKLLIEIKNRVAQLIQELKEKIVILKEIDLNKRKEEEKIKLIVRENLNNYIINLKRFIQKLENLKYLESNFNYLEREIRVIFFKFREKSNLNYEKATILIGKELGDIKDSLEKFSKDFEKILKINKTLIKELQIFKLIKEKIEERGKILEIKYENEKEKQETYKKIKNLKKEKEIIENKIIKIKKSEEYLNKLKKKEIIKNELNNIKNEKNNLNKIIDYKLLAKNFHRNKEKMETIKEYKENFNENLLKDQGKKIINLLNEAEIDSNTLGKKIKEIFEKQKKIENLKIEEDETKKFNRNVEKINSQIETLSWEGLEIMKKNNKLEEKNKKIISSIAKELIPLKVGIKGVINL